MTRTFPGGVRVQPASLRAITRGRRVSLVAVGVAALLGTSPALVHADPLSLVQSLRNGEDGTTFPGEPLAIATRGNQLHAATRGLFQLFEREATTGVLTPLDEIVSYDSETEPAPGDAQVYEGLGILGDELLLVEGAARGPELCADSPNCDRFGPLAISTSGGQLAVVERGDKDTGSQRNLITSPDGRHAYGLSGEAEGGGLTIFSVDAAGKTTVVEVLGDDYRLDGSPAIASRMVFTPDARFALVNTFDLNDIRTSRITTLRRDPESGSLTAVAEIDASSEPGDVFSIDHFAVSPDGGSLYVSAAASAGSAGSSGLAHYRIGEDGSLAQVAIDRTPNAGAEGSFDFPQQIAISPNGRLILVGNAIGSRDEQQSLHLFTVGDDGATTWRGFEQSNGDGVLEDDLANIASVAFSSDGAFAYALAGRSDEGVLSTFAAHADNVTSIRTPTNVLSGGSATATVRLFNAGPARAHGVVATVDASGPITSTDRADTCTIDGSRAVCRIDELDAMGSTEIGLVASAPDAGELTLSVTTTQYQVDMDAATNTATATVPVVDDPALVDGTPTETATPGGPGVGETPGGADVAGDAGESNSSSGGGCAIVSRGTRDPLFALLLLASGFGVLARRRATVRRR